MSKELLAMFRCGHCFALFGILAEEADTRKAEIETRLRKCPACRTEYAIEGLASVEVRVFEKATGRVR